MNTLNNFIGVAATLIGIYLVLVQSKEGIIEKLASGTTSVIRALQGS